MEASCFLAAAEKTHQKKTTSEQGLRVWLRRQLRDLTLRAGDQVQLWAGQSPEALQATWGRELPGSSICCCHLWHPQTLPRPAAAPSCRPGWVCVGWVGDGGGGGGRGVGGLLPSPQLFPFHFCSSWNSLQANRRPDPTRTTPSFSELESPFSFWPQFPGSSSQKSRGDPTPLQICFAFLQPLKGTARKMRALMCPTGLAA